MVRHSAHRNAVIVAGFPGSQGDFQLPRRQFRIVKKQFVKIAETEHQQILRMLFFYLTILFHHGGVIQGCIPFLSETAVPLSKNVWAEVIRIRRNTPGASSGSVGQRTILF